MLTNNRRDFLKNSLIAAAALSIPQPLIAFGKEKYKLAFSTIGCPKWSLEEIVTFASKNNFKGIEFRGLNGEIDLTKCKEFSKEHIKASKQLFKDNGLQILGLGSSAKVHFKDKALRAQNLDEGKRYIDLANELNCASVRIFPDKLPKELSKIESMDLMTAGLIELAQHAKNTKVNVFLETHGDLVKTDDIYYVINNVNQKNVALIWDMFNMWKVTKESPSYMYAKLKPFIKHVHLKDGNIVNGKVKYTLFGQGEAPVKEMVSLLKEAGYKGYYSFEWEKMWHPTIEEPEVAFPYFKNIITDYLA